MAVQIITDSSVDVSVRFKDRFSVVPLGVFFGEKEYVDGVTLTRKEFYKMLVTSDVLPKTSQAPPAAFEDVYRKMSNEGKEAVVITASSTFSGIYQSAVMAAKKFSNIRVIDSRNVAIGSGVLAEYALQCADRGMSLDELAQHLLQIRERIRLYARLDTLKYLKKGGRISGTTALVGSILNIKPVVKIIDGTLSLVGKARGVKKANVLMNEQIGLEGVDYDKPVLIGYTGISDRMVKEYIHASRDLWRGHAGGSDAELLCSVIGTHAGPDAVVTGFFQKP